MPLGLHKLKEFPRNIKAAIEWYNKAITLGCHKAKNNLYRALVEVHDAEKNLPHTATAPQTDSKFETIQLPPPL